MLCTNMRNYVFCTKPNLTSVLLRQGNTKDYLFQYSFTVRDISTADLVKDIQYVKDRMKALLDNDAILQALKDKFISIPRTLKNQSAGVLRIWAYQCECVLAQRLRRGQQMFCLYTRLWEEHALKDLFLRMRHQISNHSKELILSATGITAYNWDSNRIKDKELKRRMGELEYIYVLRKKTLTCDICNKDSCMNSKDKDCCICRFKQNSKRTYEKWMPFLEKKDIMVWRRLDNSGSGHYEYKVYGSFNDVTAEDFLNVQIDSEYRKTWDTTAIMLEVVETDPKPSSNSQIIYWEMLWPRFFVNRDYVFNRRFLVDQHTNTVIILSRGTDHPACPVRRDKYRVQDYWSEMVIRSYTDLDKPGIEFGLTYFDNPGVSIPATVTTWVAMRAMPDFLLRLRSASLEYKLFCTKHGKQFIYSCTKTVSDVKSERNDKTVTLLNEMEEVITDNTIFEAQHPIRGSLSKSPSSQNKPRDFDGKMQDPEHHDKRNSDSNLELDSPMSTTSSTSVIKSDMTAHNYWKYFKPNYYFS